MANVITGVDSDAFDAVAFGVISQANLNFLEERVSSLSATMSEAGQEFIQRGIDIFNRYGGSEAIRMAKAAVRTVQHAFDIDCIRSLNTISGLQQAGPKMQRWIMACPDIRQLYHKQQCDGYSNSYVDMFPGSIGENHYDWRLVNTGIVEETPDDSEYEWRAVNYFDESDNDIFLTLSEKLDIRATWQYMATLLSPGKEDPTSPFCDML